MRAHILLVDDDSESREALHFALSRKNRWWTISQAGGVEEAREILESPSPEHGEVDVVLTDMVMGNAHPEGGLEVLELAKRYDAFIMVILFTAQDKRIDRVEAYKEGAFDCIEKNILGTVAAHEISAKANAAVYFRRLTLSHLRDQEQIHSLERFFDPRIFHAIREDPKFLDLRMRPTTVLFWDLRGFSRLCVELDQAPELIRGFLVDYYQLATAVIFRHNGILDKLIGDGVMALFCGFGAPEEKLAQRGAIDAAEAALELRELFEQLLRTWEERWRERSEISVGLGCGMHTGDSLVGSLGVSSHNQFTAIGPHVNFASRLESRAKEGQVLISATTAEQLPSSFEVKSLGVARNIKNIPGEYAIYRLDGRLDGRRA